MAAAGKIGDLAFKTCLAGLGVATIYLTLNFSGNVYRGLAWHRAQKKAEEEDGILHKAGDGSTHQNDEQA